MSESYGSDLDSGDNLDSQEDRSSSGSGGDRLLVEEDAGTAAPTMTAVAATAVDTHINDPTRSDLPSFEKLYGEKLDVCKFIPRSMRIDEEL